MRRIDLYLGTCAYCAGVVALLLTGTKNIVLALASIAVVYALLFKKRRLRSMMIIGCACAIAWVRIASASPEYAEAFADLYDHEQRLSGTVVTLPDIRETNERVTVEIHRGNARTRVLAAVPLYPEVHVGDKIVIYGTLRRPRPFATDGGRAFAYDDYLRKDGIFGVMQPAHATIEGRSSSLWLQALRLLERLKIALINSLRIALPDPENSLAVGILLGGKQGLGTVLLEAFTRAGMLQIVVLSGYNVMIVASTLMRVLGKLPVHARLSAGTASIAGFVLIAGAGSSALRAGLMAFGALAAATFGRQYDVLVAVMASLLALALWNPLILVYDPGFQFSFIATIGLVLGAPITASWLVFLKNPILIELLSTTLAAEIALLPLLLWQTGNLSVISVVANVIAMPAVPLAMAASAFAMAAAWPLHFLHPMLPLVIGTAAYFPLAYIIKVATLCASLPFASIIIPAFPFWIVIAAYGALAGWYLRRLRRGSGALQRSNSDYPERHLRTSSSPPACSRP